MLVGLHFALPFLVLLSRRVKRNPALLAKVALLLLVLRLVDLYWLVLPAFYPDGFTLALAATSPRRWPSAACGSACSSGSSRDAR